MSQNLYELASTSQLQSFLIDQSFCLVVIDFYADWCGPCKVMAPHFEKLAASHPKAVFLKVNIDRFGELASRYSITAMPTYAVLKDGQVVEKVVGANLSKLQSAVASQYSA